MSCILHILAIAILTFPPLIQTKAVFAHFMIANSENYTLPDWKSDITAAQAAHIDAFALNAGFGLRNSSISFANAFSAAQELDFKLFFSLDYSGDGHWPKDQVITLLKNYTTHPAYYRHEGKKALVSTFEGFQSAGDWDDIKEKVSNSTGDDRCCFFIPDWTSVGPRRALAVGAVDGLMSWDAWPDGTKSMNTTEDEEYISYLDGKPYIMPVSPWFYTNLGQFHKNWVWRGDDLWYTRWQEVLQIQPEYVEILTWNDYGESHYIGPLRENALGILGSAAAPFDYVKEMAHDGWRVLLPYLIEQYKAESDQERAEVDIAEEVLSVWYRLSHAAACGDGKTTGNTESQHQTLRKPGEVLQDQVFYSALLEGDADVWVSIGGVNRSEAWVSVPEGAKGVYHGHADMDGRTGEVVVTVVRHGGGLAEMKGRRIEEECPRNLTNWNAWVGNATVVRENRVKGDQSDPSSGGLSIRVAPWWMALIGLGLFI